MPWTIDRLPESVKHKKWSAKQKEIFVHAANAALEEYGDDGKAIATGTAAADRHGEKTNAKQHARIYYARHMQPGIAGGYEDGSILVDTDAIKRMLPSAVGKPVYVDHQKVKLDTLKEDAAGYITEAFYNEKDGWAWFKILVIDDKAHDCINNGYAVSNAYIPFEYGQSGTKNNCPYDKEVLSGEFTHLAIVSTPRYEGAMILTPEEFKTYQDSKAKELAELQNSKPTTKGTTMFKMFKLVKEEVTQPDADTLIELANGKTVKLSEIVNAKEKEEKKNEDDMDVMVNGKKVKLSSLKKWAEKHYSNELETEEEEEREEHLEEEDEEDEGVSHKNKKAKKNKKVKKNADKEEKGEEDATDDKKGKEEEDEEEKGHEDEHGEKKNDKYFHEIANANRRKEESVTILETSMDKLARGKERY